MSQRKRHSPELKTKAVLDLLKEEKSLTELASTYGIHGSMLIRWKNQAIQELPKIFLDQRKKEKDVREDLVKDLYERIGLLSTQVEWLKKKSGLNPDNI
jgi:transposase